MLRDMQVESRKEKAALHSRLSKLEASTAAKSVESAETSPLAWPEWKPQLPQTVPTKVDDVPTQPQSMENARLLELLTQQQTQMFKKQEYSIADVVKWCSENGYPAISKVPQDQIPTELPLGPESPTVVLSHSQPYHP